LDSYKIYGNSWSAIYIHLKSNIKRSALAHKFASNKFKDFVAYKYGPNAYQSIIANAPKADAKKKVKKVEDDAKKKVKKVEDDARKVVKKEDNDAKKKLKKMEDDAKKKVEDNAKDARNKLKKMEDDAKKVKSKEERDAKKEAKKVEDDAKKVKRKEERDAKKEDNDKTLGGGWAEPWQRCTAVSKYRQEVEPGRIDPGQYTIKSAKKAGSGDIKIIDDLLPQELKQQLLDCTACKQILPIDRPLVQDLI